MNKQPAEINSHAGLEKYSVLQPMYNNILKLIGMVLALGKLEWAVAPADERSMHKYNGSTYEMDNNHNPVEMEGSTTYTLPYWMGRYYGLLGD